VAEVLEQFEYPELATQLVQQLQGKKELEVKVNKSLVGVPSFI